METIFIKQYIKICLFSSIIILGYSCNKQSDEKPRFHKGATVSYNDICPNGYCGMPGDKSHDIMPMYVDDSYSAAPGYPGHLFYICHDSSVPSHKRTIIDYDLKSY